MSDSSEKFLQALLDLDIDTLHHLILLIEDVVDFKLNQMEAYYEANNN